MSLKHTRFIEEDNAVHTIVTNLLSNGNYLKDCESTYKRITKKKGEYVEELRRDIVHGLVATYFVLQDLYQQQLSYIHSEHLGTWWSEGPMQDTTLP